MRYLLISVFLASFSFGMRGQQTEYLELAKAESRLQSLFNDLYSDHPVDPDSLISEIQTIMPEALARDGAMDYPWSKLNKIGVITSDDRRIRTFTWHVKDNPDHYRYFGYIQVAGRKNRVEVFPLRNNGKPQSGLYNLDQSPDNWYGKLYYGIVSRKVKRRTSYTLLGMDFNNSRSNLKFVEMLELQRNKPKFKKKSFTNGKDVVDRVVLEYSDQTAISVRYDPRLDMIVYDHLVPFHPVYKDQYEFYGPDGSFDGLRFEDGMWLLREDIDARMPD